MSLATGALPAGLRTPVLLLDLEKLEANLAAMAASCRALGVALRPHVKTHKCLEIARRQLALGGRGITVATLYEAEVFAAHGFDDITWAYPLILDRVDQALELANKTTLRLVVDSREAVSALEATSHPLHVWLKTDCGYHRAGVDPDSEAALRLAERLDRSPHLILDGILTHSGHAYKAASTTECRAVAEQERDVMLAFAARLRGAGIEVAAISVGSTPAMAQIRDLTGIDEARPGNYAFYDRSQVAMGSCRVTDCAVTVLTSVVSVGRDHSVLDAGALALSKDLGPSASDASDLGRPYADYRNGQLAESRITSLSQEHGILSHRLGVGERLRILPNHSCLTVAQFDELVVVSGSTLVGRWKVWRGRD